MTEVRSRLNTRIRIWAIALTIATLTACSNNTPPVPAQQPMPQTQQQYAQPAVQQAVPAQPTTVIVQQQPVAAPAHSGSGDMLTGAALGGLAGYMVGNSGNRQQAAAPAYVDRRPVYVDRRPIVQKTVVNKTVIVQQRPQAPSRPAPLRMSKR